MYAHEFVEKWSKTTLNEKASAQSFIDDLCRVVGHLTPAECDPTGEFFRYEKHTDKTFSGKGFVDAWYKGKFAWEHKGKGKDLDKAYKQLLEYREGLENPPLLIVSDFETIIIKTNFNNTPPKIFTIHLSQLPNNVHILKSIFFDPDTLKDLPQVNKTSDTYAKIRGAIGGSLGMALIGGWLGMFLLHNRVNDLDIGSFGIVDRWLVGFLAGGLLGGVLGAFDGWSRGTKAWFKSIAILLIFILCGVVGGTISFTISSMTTRLDATTGGIIGGIIGAVTVLFCTAVFKLILPDRVWNLIIESFVGSRVWANLEGYFPAPLSMTVLNVLVLPIFGMLIGAFIALSLADASASVVELGDTTYITIIGTMVSLLFGSFVLWMFSLGFGALD